MSDTPPNRNPKRQRKKEGAQARRAAELAALRRQQRNRRIIRMAVLAVVVVGGILLISALGGDDKKDDSAKDASATTETSVAEGSTTTVPLDVTPMTCDPASGENTDLSAKPTITVPAAPVTDLQCQDLVVGDGDEVVSAGDTVTVEYVGVSQSSGKEFDSSWDEGEDPVTFELTQVISGWTQGIPGMKVGGRRLLTIPGDQAYGEAGHPPDIGPNDTLVFVVDLVDVKHVTDG
jgi:FKBP-type peptidyl-prolyl cis-trans isomerase